jgi:hypothetical protein
VLITDENIVKDNSVVKSSERNARYDGIITFGSNLTMVIENKPRSKHVWAGQLHPSQQNLAGETIVYSNPAILEWKEVIKQLTHLLDVPTISGYEKMMIEDFLSYVNEGFSYLNPYDSLHQCNGSTELINRRLSNLLKSIALDENKVNIARKWGFYIQTDYEPIQRIGLILNKNEKESFIELHLWFGDSPRQAISFYNSNLNIGHLKNTKWQIRPNFHVSFMSSNLVWFESEDSERYLKFWKENVKEIYQQKRGDVQKYLKRLADKKIIKVTKDAEKELKERFYDTAMQNLNICPGFGIVFPFSLSEAEVLDKNGKLKFILAERIKEGLKVVGLDGKEILTKL